MVAVYAHAMLGRMRLRTSASFFLLALTVFPLNARVLQVEIASRSAVLNGKEFGAAGAYERYGNREDYLARYQTALGDLVQQRWILPEDHAALIHRGEQEWIESTK